MLFQREMLSRLHQDYLAGFLRSQIAELQTVLNNVENSELYDEAYISESMKRIERNIKSFIRRKYNN